MLETRTQGGRRVGIDKSTELWRHPTATGTNYILLQLILNHMFWLGAPKKDV